MSLRSSLASEIGNGVCQILGNIADAVDFSRSLFPGASTDGTIVDTGRGLLVDIPFVNTARGLGALLCNREPLPLPPPQFDGGQCNGVPYLVTADAELVTSICTSSGTVGQTQRVWGPISSILPSNVQPCSAPGGPFSGQDLAQLWEIRCRGLVQPPAPPGPPGTVVQILAASRPNKAVSSFNVSVARDDGQPDDCGNPPPEVPYPTPGYNIINNNNFTFIDNQGNNITIPLALVYFRPEIDLNGNFKIPVEINLGGIDFGGTIDPDGNVEITPPQGRRPQLPGGSPSDGGGGSDAPPVPPGTPDPVDRIPSDPSEERKMIGVVVTVTNLQNQRATEIAQVENPPIYAPNLGFVNFFYQVDTKRGAWSKDFPVKNRNQFIPVDYDKGAIDVKGTPQGGVEWELTPIYDRTFDRSPILEPVIQEEQ